MIFPRHGDEDHGAVTADGPSHDSSGAAGGSGMMMMMMSVFQTDTQTPLYSTGWTPQNVAGYAATIIFLVAFVGLAYNHLDKWEPPADV